MKDWICCSMFCLGVGMIAGAVIAVSNKKVGDFVAKSTTKVSSAVDDLASKVSHNLNQNGVGSN